jgi:hypothetical protein
MNYLNFQFEVHWHPPYTNAVKRQPCYTLNEAEAMVKWFESINVPAEVFHLEVKERPWDTKEQRWG